MAKVSRLALSAAIAAIAQMTLASASRAAEPLHVDGGAIADVARDAIGVRAFKGIPYAAPPVGGLRWKPPQVVQAWSDVRSSTEWGPRCMQSDRLGEIDPLNKRMDEDCLYLNVWTPAKSEAQKLAVMVWIHGGSNLNGAGSQPEYDGARLASKGVVVVTINYRLDIFGFLAHPELTKESDTPCGQKIGTVDEPVVRSASASLPGA
jgi:para-nitrobenzyl esterase